MKRTFLVTVEEVTQPSPPDLGPPDPTPIPPDPGPDLPADPDPGPVDPPPVGPGSDEPLYDPSVNTLVAQDDMSGYTTLEAMGAKPRGSTPRIVPTPSPVQTGAPVDPSKNEIIKPGRNASKQALRLKFSGKLHAGADWDLLRAPEQSSSSTHYFQYFGRVQFASPPQGSVAIKWFMAWHRKQSGLRMQWSTHNRAPCPTGQHEIYWQIYDGSSTSRCQGNQPVGPYLYDKDGRDDIADYQWHRFTHMYKPNSVQGARDGIARMWIDGKKIIDVSFAAAGITPPGGEKSWCEVDDVDLILVDDGIGNLKWGGPQTTGSPPWTLDIDDFIWWVA